MNYDSIRKNSKYYKHDHLLFYKVFSKIAFSELGLYLKHYLSYLKFKNIRLKERLILSSCYITFGLTGLLLLIDNIFLSNLLFEYQVNKSIILHTIQSTILTFTTYAMIVLIGLLQYVHTIFTSPESYDQNTFLYLTYMIIYFSTLLSFVLAFVSILGYNSYLPGVKRLAYRFFNSK